MGWDYKAGVLSCQNAADRKEFAEGFERTLCASLRKWPFCGILFVYHHRNRIRGYASLPLHHQASLGPSPGVGFVVFQRFADGFIGQLPVR